MNSPLEKSIEINCSVEHAFRIFVDKIDLWWPVGHRKFEKSTLSLDAKIGGQFLEIAADGAEFKMGEVLQIDVPNHIQYSWFPGAIKLPTLVNITFSQQAEMTLVRVTHSEGESALGEVWPKRVTIFTRSWDVILNSVKIFIEPENTD